MPYSLLCYQREPPTRLPEELVDRLAHKQCNDRASISRTFAPFAAVGRDRMPDVRYRVSDSQWYPLVRERAVLQVPEHVCSAWSCRDHMVSYLRLAWPSVIVQYSPRSPRILTETVQWFCTS